MSAILATFVSHMTPPSVLAVSPDYTLINIFAVAVITAVAAACAVALRKPRDRPGH